MAKPKAFYEPWNYHLVHPGEWVTHLEEGGLYDNIQLDVSGPGLNLRGRTCFTWDSMMTRKEARDAYEALRDPQFYAAMTKGLPTLSGLPNNGKPHVDVRCLCQKVYQISYQWTHHCPCGVRISVDSGGGITMTQGGVLVAGGGTSFINKIDIYQSSCDECGRFPVPGGPQLVFDSSGRCQYCASAHTTCDTCFGTGYFKGYGAPCQKGCKPR